MKKKSRVLIKILEKYAHFNHYFGRFVLMWSKYCRQWLLKCKTNCRREKPHREKMRRSQQRSCSQTHTSSRNGLLNFLRPTRGRLRISFRNTAIMPSSVTSCLWTGSCRTLETRGEFQQFMDTLWNSTSVLMHSSVSVDALAVNTPHNLPTLSVVLIYLDEALSVIQRAICSLINRTPAHLLKEIILVDDHSTNGSFLSNPIQP